MESLHPNLEAEQGALIAVTVIYVLAFAVLVWTTPADVILAWSQDILGWIRWTKP